MKAALYTAYHKPSSFIESPSIVPIHVGRGKGGTPLAGMIGDDTGDNISALNGSYCELTALYWAWKNDSESTHLGLMHYRRLLDFDQSMQSTYAEVLPGQLRMADYAERTEKWLAANAEVDLVLPVPHKMPISVRTNYLDKHDPRDLEFIEARIRDTSPEYLEDWNAVMEGRDLLLANMFMARREIILPYIEWAFDLLEALRASDISRKYVSSYNARYLGFVSERLFTVWARKYLRENPTAKVHRVNILNLSQSLVFPFISGDEFNGPETVNVAFSSDANYLPHTAAMIRTLIDHADPERRYNLFYLHENIEPRRMELLSTLLFGAPHVTLHPINVGNPFGDHYRARHHAPTNATFNRFLLFDLLPDLNRLIYIDVDMVLKGDIAEIFDIDMGDHQLAAVPDFIMTRLLATKVETQDPAVPDLGKHLREDVGLSDEQLYSYFNAGLMVLNFAKMDMAKVNRELMDMVEKTKFFFRDQDILNSYFKDSYLRLPAKYNVFNSPNLEYMDVPVDNFREAMSARNEPFIIHFAAAPQKPWRYPDVPFAQDYWTALERTPFWLETLEKTIESRGLAARLRQKHTYKMAVLNFGRWVARKLPWLRPMLYKLYAFLLRRFRWLR